MKILSIRVKPEMLQGLREVAERDLSSVTVEVRQAVAAHLERKGIDWRILEQDGDSYHQSGK